MSASGELPPSTPQALARPRLGFLGVGWIGRRRLESILDAQVAEVAAIADPVLEQVAELTRIAPHAKGMASLDELLEADLDGLVIATPSALHAEQTIAALRRGLAVFCQKPLGRDAREVGEIIDAARQADRLLGVDLSYRHVLGLQKIRALLREGALGKVFAVELVFHNAYGPSQSWFYDPKLSGGGCVVDLGIHLVDAALWCLETSVIAVSSRVFAQGAPLPAGREVVEDYATARLDLENGAVANLACSWRLHAGCGAEIKAVFYGPRGGAALRNVNGSFTDFVAERFSGTNTELLAEPPDDWGGRAAVAWARRLSADRRFDPEIERQIEVAATLDAIYAQGSSARVLEGERR